MLTAKLGRTELEINPLGFGGIPIQRISFEAATELLEYAINKGINFIDTARLYGDSEAKIGQVIPKYRDQVVIATKAMSRDKAGMAAEIEESLKNLKVNCIDIYQCHNVRSIEQLDQILSDDGAYAALLEAKAQGKIKFIGITSHKTPILIEAIRRDKFDTVQVPFNIIEQEPAKELFHLCKEKNIGVIIMKPLAGGALKDNAPASLKYILNHPVSVVIPGMESKSQVDENLSAVLNPTLTDEEARALQAEAESLGNRFCRKCDYCAPCPNGVDISFMFILDAYYTRYNMPEWATNRYRSLKIDASNCVECGQCEAKCPYELPIIEMLKEVHKHMGKEVHEHIK
ncbi:aldo/keto reductase [Anoxybacter fermentans]|uniref:Aldo/keto reductase n=1 Tax=Anoxybacter fermentans TaxID=1323375 RepID=A0A3Q9HPK5_9FIRM|nr:aldo/keto reductase [Anoxybacter fermentans]AZR72806.1 aldo/keto reductase [Anoxybacter fermentans]